MGEILNLGEPGEELSWTSWIKDWEVKLFHQWKENYKPREDPLDQVSITSLLWREWAFVIQGVGTAWRNSCLQKWHWRRHSQTLLGISKPKASSSIPRSAGMFSFYRTLRQTTLPESILRVIPLRYMEDGMYGREGGTLPPLTSSPAGLFLFNVSTLKVGSQTVDVEAWGRLGEGQALDFNGASCQVRRVGRIWERGLQSYLSRENSRSLHILWNPSDIG